MTSEWAIKSLGDVVEIYDGPHATPKKTSTGPIFLGISNIVDGRLDLSSTEHLSEQDFLHWTRRITPMAGDVVFSYETRLGEAALIPEGLKCCLGRRMGLLRPKDSRIDSRYLLYAYLAPEFQDVVRARTVHGSTVDRIPLIEMPSFPFRVPDVATQRAIAQVLGSLDDKIELNRQMNRTLEEMARAIFKSWFVDFDPVYAKARGEQPVGMDAATAALFPATFDDTELGSLPSGWGIASLDDIANYRNGLALQKFPPEDSDYLPVIKIRELRQGFSDDSSDKASPQITPECIIDDGDIVFSWSGSLLVDMWCGGRGALNQHLFKVTSSQYPKWFYYYWTKQHLDEFQRIAADKATTMGHIKRHHLTDAKVFVPSASMLSRASEVIEPLLEAMLNNQLESRTLTELRDTLLPKLMSGELRVPEAVEIAATPYPAAEMTPLMEVGVA